MSGCISDRQEEDYRTLVDVFVEWSARNLLLLNGDMVIDFKSKKPA